MKRQRPTKEGSQENKRRKEVYVLNFDVWRIIQSFVFKLRLFDALHKGTIAFFEAHYFHDDNYTVRGNSWMSMTASLSTFNQRYRVLIDAFTSQYPGEIIYGTAVYKRPLDDGALSRIYTVSTVPCDKMHNHEEHDCYTTTRYQQSCKCIW